MENGEERMILVVNFRDIMEIDLIDIPEGTKNVKEDVKIIVIMVFANPNSIHYTYSFIINKRKSNLVREE